jgi:hypothetical protein
MATPNRQIGWGAEENLLAFISKQIEYLTGVAYAAGGSGGSGILSLNTLNAANQTLIVGVTGTDFSIVSSGTTHEFNLPTASATNRGLLSSADWAIFNGKQASLGYTPVNKAGDSMSGALILNADPSTALGAATKQYVDNLAAGINFHEPVFVATTGTLAATYTNGVSGVGAKLTATSPGTLPIDSELVTSLKRVLVWQQSNPIENGIYDLTNDGTVGLWELTRTTDADNNPNGEIASGDFVFVQSGDTYGGFGFICNTTAPVVIGFTAINYVQFNAAQVVTAGYGLLELTPNVLSADTSILLTKNFAITGDTKTKITYDTNGLVTAGSDATTADIADSINKRYQTDLQQSYNDATSSIQTQLDAKLEVLQVTPVTLTAASWTLVSGLYQYTYSNVNILSTSIVDVIPTNSTIAIVKAADVLPATLSTTGNVTLYATNAPTADIIVTVNIYN